MKRLAVAFVLALALSVGATSSFGAEIDRFFEGIRPLGMGGAFTAVSDDENSLFYNPAGLTRVSKLRVGLVTPFGEAGENAIDFYDDFDKIDDDNTTEVADLLRRYIGKYIYGRAGLMPHAVWENWGLALLGQGAVRAEPHNLSNPEVVVEGFGSTSVHLGYGKELGKLSVGITAKYVKMWRLDEVYEAAAIADENFDDRIDDDIKKGEGFGIDLGATYTFEDVLLQPSIAIAAINFWEPNKDKLGELARHFNIGLGLSQEILGITFTGALDVVDVTTQLGDDNDLYKRIHAGLEVQLTKYLQLRTGLNQGYGSVGATLDLWILKLDYAWYAEEVGAAAGMEIDKRHAFMLSLGW